MHTIQEEKTMTFISVFDMVWKKLGYPTRIKFVIDIVVVISLLLVLNFLYNAQMTCGELFYTQCYCPCAVFSNGTINIDYFNMTPEQLSQLDNITEFITQQREYGLYTVPTTA